MEYTVYKWNTICLRYLIDKDNFLFNNYEIVHIHDSTGLLPLILVHELF